MASGHVDRRRTKTDGVVWRCIVEAGRDPVSGSRRRITRQFATRQEAQKALRTILTELEGGTFVEASNLTVAEYLTDVWLPAHRRVVRPNTWANYQLMVNAHLLPALGGIRLQKLRHAHISALYEDLLNGHRSRKLSAKSVRNIHMILRKALADACDWGYLTRNPARPGAATTGTESQPTRRQQHHMDRRPSPAVPRPRPRRRPTGAVDFGGYDGDAPFRAFGAALAGPRPRAFTAVSDPNSGRCERGAGVR